MATKSFTRDIVISDKNAIEKILRMNNSDNSKIDEIIAKNRQIIDRKTAPSTIQAILEKY
ncbi:MAG: hypothetical protein JEY99_21730 [Spirochaetales bacterium]|nr:hypothetical protein [Spirochaetales bacterium]